MVSLTWQESFPRAMWLISRGKVAFALRLFEFMPRTLVIVPLSAHHFWPPVSFLLD